MNLTVVFLLPLPVVLIFLLLLLLGDARNRLSPIVRRIADTGRAMADLEWACGQE
jgi:hypothetical protein